MISLTTTRFRELAARYANLRIAVVGDYCLDRYLEIDVDRQEVSIETGLPVHNVVRVRSQPGGAGTVLNNLVALGIGSLWPIGFCGDDGEGFELRRALEQLPGVALDHFLTSSERRTFTYCKPLLCHPAEPPQELNRLDSKNWTPTPSAVEEHIVRALRSAAAWADAVIVLDQVDLAETGAITHGVREEIARLMKTYPRLRIVADSRRGLTAWPPVTWKMNAAELAKLLDVPLEIEVSSLIEQAQSLARRHQNEVCVTMAERGLLLADRSGEACHVPALPLRGPIDIVGAGDSVTANLAAALAVGATSREALEIAAIASSLVIHQLGTTGAASPHQIEQFLVS